jgi:hypothetical protein
MTIDDLERMLKDQKIKGGKLIDMLISLLFVIGLIKNEQSSTYLDIMR